uniref:Uncharacterized protein n=1 Tax=Rhizophagus irregularis (strain DAOM 181602 / DAOM 197198 / MUCL 43194) TaxID=747089 RepID=U9UDQ4_RHIID
MICRYAHFFLYIYARGQKIKSICPLSQVCLSRGVFSMNVDHLSHYVIYVTPSTFHFY